MIDDQSGVGTQIVAGLDENSADNTYVWDTRGVSNGTYFYYADITDVRGTTRSLTSSTPKLITAPMKR